MFSDKLLDSPKVDVVVGARVGVGDSRGVGESFVGVGGRPAGGQQDKYRNGKKEVAFHISLLGNKLDTFPFIQ